jgi:hypothetical protein
VSIRSKALALFLAICIPTFEPLSVLHADDLVQSSQKSDPLSDVAVETQVLESQDHSVNIGMARGEATPAQIDKMLAAVPADEDLVVSTDSETVEKAVEAEVQHEKPNARGLRRIIPLGHLLKAAESLSTSISKDKLGFVIVTFTTGIDTYKWIHATQYSSEAASLEAIYSVLLAIAYGYDKDTWGNYAKKFQNKLMKILDFALIPPQALKVFSFLSANFLMWMPVQYGRIGFLNIGSLHPMSTAAVVGATAALAAASTIRDAAWTIFSLNVDEDALPFSKKVVRRISDVRSFVMGLIAPSNRLLRPDQFGFLPWISMVVTGSIGAYVLLNSKRFVNWLENSPRLDGLRSVMTKWSDGLDSSLAWLKKSKNTSCPGLLEK